MITVTDVSLDTVISSNDLILIDFWAEWCGPCKKVLPILQELSDEGVVLIGKLNVDDNPQKTLEYSIFSIPSMVLFKGGKPVKTIQGAKPKHALLKELEEWI
jgi:thioredoxin 1